MPNVMKAQRLAINVTKEVQIATPLHSALLPVESHMVSATQVLESARHVTQQLTKIAHKLRLHVTKNAQSWLFQNVIKILENALNAKRVVQVAYQQQHANQHAERLHQSQLTHINAAGTLLPQNALLIQTEP